MFSRKNKPYKVDTDKLEEISKKCSLTQEEKTTLHEIANKKKLNEQLNDDEQCRLGKLFPMEISDPSYMWYGAYQNEETLLKSTLGKCIEEIHHIGSTAVIGLPAKPVIDILILVKVGTNAHEIYTELEKSGYGVRIIKEKNILHVKARKGYTIEGITGQLYHLHIFETSEPNIRDTIIFRDCLIADENLRTQYASLKFSLTVKNKYDRELYTQGKSDFIKKVIESARTKK